MEVQTVAKQSRFSWLGKQIPNILTVIRIILVPVFIYLFIVATNGDKYFQLGYFYYYQLAALIVFCVAAYTDYLDGLLARRWNLVSNFGKLVDPIADKALMMSSFILLSYYSWLYWWFTILVIFREFAVTFMRFMLLRGGKVLPASQGGKLKTLLQCLLVFLLLLQPLIQYYSFVLTILYIEILVLVAAFVATILSGFVYFLDSWKDLRDIVRQLVYGRKAKSVVVVHPGKEKVPVEEQLTELEAERVSQQLVSAREKKEDSELSVANRDLFELHLAEKNISEDDLEKTDCVETEEGLIFNAPIWRPLKSTVTIHSEEGSNKTRNITEVEENQLLEYTDETEETELKIDLENTQTSTLMDIQNSTAGIKYPPRRKRKPN